MNPPDTPEIILSLGIESYPSLFIFSSYPGFCQGGVGCLNFQRLAYRVSKGEKLSLKEPSPLSPPLPAPKTALYRAGPNYVYLFYHAYLLIKT
jgi:hypothetical protein